MAEERFAVLYPDGCLYVLPLSPDMAAKAFLECDAVADDVTVIGERPVVVRVGVAVIETPPRPDGRCPTCGAAPKVHHG